MNCKIGELNVWLEYVIATCNKGEGLQFKYCLIVIYKNLMKAKQINMSIGIPLNTNSRLVTMFISLDTYLVILANA